MQIRKVHGDPGESISLDIIPQISEISLTSMPREHDNKKTLEGKRYSTNKHRSHSFTKANQMDSINNTNLSSSVMN